MLRVRLIEHVAQQDQQRRDAPKAQLAVNLPSQLRRSAPTALPSGAEYLAGLDETNRTTLQQLRQYIRDALPDIEECISYGMPAFKVDGKTVAGFAAFKNHLSRLPHSGSVLPACVGAHRYEGTKGSLHFGRCTSRSMNRSRATWSRSCSRPA